MIFDRLVHCPLACTTGNTKERFFSIFAAMLTRISETVCLTPYSIYAASNTKMTCSRHWRFQEELCNLSWDSFPCTICLDCQRPKSHNCSSPRFVTCSRSRTEPARRYPWYFLSTQDGGHCLSWIPDQLCFNASKSHFRSIEDCRTSCQEGKGGYAVLPAFNERSFAVNPKLRWSMHETIQLASSDWSSSSRWVWEGIRVSGVMHRILKTFSLSLHLRTSVTTTRPHASYTKGQLKRLVLSSYKNGFNWEERWEILLLFLLRLRFKCPLSPVFKLERSVSYERSWTFTLYF